MSLILGILASGGGAAAPTNFIAVGHTTSPNLSVYPWLPGFGTKYANPATVPAGDGTSVTWDATKAYIGVSVTATPFIAIYPWSNATGFGTKYSDPAILPTGSANGISFSSDSAAVAIAHNASPRVTAYPWSASGFGTKFTNPATLPTGDGFSVSFNLSAAVAVAHATSPRVTAYPWSGSGFGTKYANPATLPVDTAYAVRFNNAGTALSVGSTGSIGQSRMNVYAWSSGFGTRYAPAVVDRQVYGTAFTPLGTTIGFATSAPPYVDIYPWNNPGFGTKYSDPGASIPDVGVGIGFSATSDAVAIAHDLSPYVTAYPWSTSTGFGTKYADPATLPAGNADSIAFI